MLSGFLDNVGGSLHVDASRYDDGDDDGDGGDGGGGSREHPGRRRGDALSLIHI